MTTLIMYTSARTILFFGTRYVKFPTVKAPLVADMSSEILSREVDVTKFGVIYAGAQKNVAPAGVTIVIARKDLIENPLAICPTMLKWKTQADNGSLYNTPPCFSIYMANLVFRHLKKLGGIKEINKINEYKAGLLYDFIDNSNFYTNSVQKEFRSIMNVPFVTPSKELDEKFVKESKAAGLVSLKGHRLVGGMRASIYNAMPVEGRQSAYRIHEEVRKREKRITRNKEKRTMPNILKLNAISEVADKEFPEGYVFSNEVNKPDGIMLRSFNMHDYPLNDELLAVARAGAGTNNIPIPTLHRKRYRRI